MTMPPTPEGTRPTTPAPWPQPSGPPAAPPPPPYTPGYGEAPVHGAPPQQPAYAPYAPAYAPYAPASPYGAPHAPWDDPEQRFGKGIGSLGPVRHLLWSLLAAHAAVVVGAALLIAGTRPGAGADLTAGGEVLSGIGVLLYLGLGTAVWALLALWCSHLSVAARVSGNARGSLSHMAWWGVFVPVATLVLPFLAYRDAARYTLAVSRSGQPRGGGEGWKALPLPKPLLAWWVLHAVSVLLFGGFGSVEPGTDAEGVLLLLSGLVGAASAVVGALALTRLARAGQSAVAAMRRPY